MRMKIKELLNLPVFPFAEEFPMLSEEEAMELAQDLEVNGQQHPIILWFNEDGRTMVLDGRNRLHAFQKTNLTEADIEYFEGSEFQAVEKVRALNILRRHLTVGQRAMAAQAYLPYEEAEAKKRQGTRTDLNIQPESAEGTPPKRGQARDIVAEKFNLPGQRISEAKKLLLNAPDLADKVKSDELSLDKATRELKARNEAREKKLHELQTSAQDLFYKVDRGEISLDEAYVQLESRNAAKKRELQARSEALYSIQLFSENVDRQLRDFNLKIAKFNDVTHVDQALKHLDTVSEAISVTRTALSMARVQIEADDGDGN